MSTRRIFKHEPTPEHVKIKIEKPLSFKPILKQTKRDQKAQLMKEISEMRECGFGKYRMEKRVKPNDRFGYMELYINKK